MLVTHPPRSAASHNVVPAAAWSGASAKADQRSRRRKKPARVIPLLVATILVVLVGYVLARMDWKPVLIHAAADASMPNQAEQLSNASAPNTQDEVQALNLRVDPRGNDAFELSWNPQCPMIKDAISGSLLINDDRHLSRFVHLNADDLHSGRLMYMTGSADVTFRFKVMDIVGHDTVQSFRVLKDAAESGPALTAAALTLGLFPGSQPSVSPIQNEADAPVTGISLRNPSVAPSMEPALEDAPDSEPRQLLTNPVLPIKGVGVTLAPSLSAAVRNFVPETPIQVNTVPPPATLLSAPTGLVDRSPTTATPPRVLFQYVPTLPRDHRHSLDVSVPVLVQISNSGTILTATLATAERNMPVELARSALDAARRWRFSPATVNGKPVLSHMTLRFHFSSK
jgi:protein TonB